MYVPTAAGPYMQSMVVTPSAAHVLRSADPFAHRRVESAPRTVYELMKESASVRTRVSSTDRVRGVRR